MIRRITWSAAAILAMFSIANASDVHRVITGLDANNKSTALFDSQVPLEAGKSGNPGAILWITDSYPLGFSQEDTASDRLA
jgi:hypothetical protein